MQADSYLVIKVKIELETIINYFHKLDLFD